ncbi:MULTISPECIES: carbon-nitrogen hydrolase family protein [unclassified Bradyrhizobium]|uniref:carbon-nitrogen hydrolase family protein n=1 Tax=unclassified Bradyrhizobium TaxID=2631580 RepID=UPI001CD744F1|nr:MULTISPECIES: carbon-nitrogen hydrolase family protein [unclassified Bradyrhizobium]MCA1378944.1 hypothetical protein [Bradyrhizobium sp. IC4060]MCA1489021.1 hypothetical protein [Bradyrhizobium sp. IC4061]
MSFTAGAIQLTPASPTLAETTNRIVDLINGAGRLATLPELALTPYFAIGVKDISRYTDVGENDAGLVRIAAQRRRTA